ncbi:MAG: peroxiredoxin family protein [Aureispira sp.]
MRGTTILISLLLLLVACKGSENKEIEFDHIKDSAHRTIPAQIAQRIHFYDAERHSISADQFNRLLADGAYVSQQRINNDGSEEVYLVSIAAHSKALEGTILPDFQLVDVEGNGYTRKDIIGKTTVLTFWMTASFVCVQELKTLNELTKQYKKERSFLWLAPALDQSADLSRFLRGKNLDFTFVSGQENFAQQLGLLAYPTHLIIDERGRIKRAIVRQAESKNLIKETLEQL